MESAGLFQDGQGQAVRLPREFRFSGDSVGIRRVGNAVVLFPKHEPRQTLFGALEQFIPDFMENREQPAPQNREDL